METWMWTIWLAIMVAAVVIEQLHPERSVVGANRHLRGRLRCHLGIAKTIRQTIYGPRPR